MSGRWRLSLPLAAFAAASFHSAVGAGDCLPRSQPRTDLAKGVGSRNDNNVFTLPALFLTPKKNFAAVSIRVAIVRPLGRTDDLFPYEKEQPQCESWCWSKRAKIPKRA
jgi:hypothetical protein